MPPTYDYLNKSKLDDVLSPLVEQKLAPLGFEKTQPLKWVSDKFPIRPIYEFVLWKAGGLTPRWGVSLDFVPHVSGSAVKWHRTKKTARFDFVVDIREFSYDLKRIYGADWLAARAPETIEWSLEKAKTYWNSVQSENDLLDAIEDLYEYYDSQRGFPFMMFTPHHITVPFVLARQGHGKLARRILDNTIERYQQVKNYPAKALIEKLDVEINSNPTPLQPNENYEHFLKYLVNPRNMTSYTNNAVTEIDDINVPGASFIEKVFGRFL